MKKLFGVLIVALMMLAAAPADAHHRYSNNARFEVMSQNLYIGADLNRLLLGESPAAVLETLQQSDFPSRAVEIAKGFDAFSPELIGLQEVYAITVFDSQGNTLYDLDFLQTLRGAIASESNVPYAVSSVVTNSDVTLPLDLEAGIFARVVDRDAILHRSDTVSVSNPMSANFEVNFVAEISGFPIPFVRGYTAVDATISGRTYRFVNTHLEVQNAPCATATGIVVCQEAQAQQLMHDLEGESDRLVLVGDFNSEPGEATYRTIANAGYKDTWSGDAASPELNGNTCCQSETLDNGQSQLSQRIDHIFVREAGVRSMWAQTTVVGDWDQRKTPGGLWYSDHGGPWARMYLYF